MGEREIKTREDFLARSPCTKSAPSGWYKSDLAAFCAVNKVPNCDPRKDTKAKLCKAISRYFAPTDEAPTENTNDFSSKRCDSSRGKGSWRVADLKAMVDQFGLPNKYSKKSDLCTQLSNFFNNAAKVPDIDRLSTPELRRLCIERKIRGCKQTKKRETFLKKLAKELPPPIEDNLSIGEKPAYYGKFVDTIVNDGIANLAALLYLLQVYKDIVCLPIRPSDLRKGNFLLQDNCDYELCWTNKITTGASGAVTESTMLWSFQDDESRFWDTVKTVCKSRFVILGLYINGLVLTESAVHRNYLIIDKTKKTLERFEPNGLGGNNILTRVYGIEALDEVLSNSTREHGYQYIPPQDFCPRIGPQLLEHYQNEAGERSDLGGFCTFWSIWYADRRLKYPDIPPKELIEKLIDQFQKNETPLLTFIRGYINFIDKKRAQIMEDAKVENPYEAIKQATLKEILKYA